MIETIEKPQIKNRIRGKGKVKTVKKHYINNQELLQELLKFKKDKIASERLGELFLTLVDNYATKSNFCHYTYVEEMKSRAIFFLLKYSLSFNPEKSNNAFSYCTQIVSNAFKQVIKKENKYIEGKKKFVEEFFRDINYFKKLEE